jgi:hypothetical protein
MNVAFPSAYRKEGRREGYVRDDVGGWPVYFEQAVAWDALKDRLRALLQHRLDAFAALSVAERHKLWLRENTRVFCDIGRYPENTPCTYHPTNSEQELLKYQEPTYKACSINITSAGWFLEHAGDGGFLPDTMLHEISHAFHDRRLRNGFQNPEVLSDFERGKTVRAFRDEYPYRNPMEYFACASVTYWGVNNFHPATRLALLSADRECHDFIAKMWTT